VLKRKTEEAEAARRKLRDLLEVQARNRKDKGRQGTAAQIGEATIQGQCGAEQLRQPHGATMSDGSPVTQVTLDLLLDSTDCGNGAMCSMSTSLAAT